MDVEGMSKPISGLIIHVGEVVQGTPAVGASVIAQVDEQHLDATPRATTPPPTYYMRLCAVTWGGMWNNAGHWWRLTASALILCMMAK
jgi:hypothetical protein